MDCGKWITPVIAICLTALVAGFNVNADKTYYYSHGYENQGYNPETVVCNYSKVRLSGELPKIRTIWGGRGAAMFITGSSTLNCYQSMFGYRHEFFPKKALLKPGAIKQKNKGIFNMKNPACYTYPEVNQCTPGDHFKDTQQDELERFTSYRPYRFSLFWMQILANITSLFALIISMMALVLSGLISWKRRNKDRLKNMIDDL